MKWELLFSFVAFGLLGSPAFAQGQQVVNVGEPVVIAEHPLAGSDDLEAAHLHFQWGLSHVANEQWLEALIEFEASITAVPNRSALFNRALCLRYLGRTAEAARALEQYLDFLGESIEPEHRAEIVRDIEELHAALTPVDVRVNVTGAVITVDGREMGRAPFDQPLLLGAGQHRICARLEGYVTQERSITIDGNQQSLELTLREEQPRGVVGMRTNVPEARLFIDGVLAGRANQRFSLEAGAHSVTGESRGFHPRQEHFFVEPGGDHWVDLSLQHRTRGIQSRRPFWSLLGVTGGSVLSGWMFGTLDAIFLEDATLAAWITSLSFAAIFSVPTFIVALLTDWRSTHRHRRHRAPSSFAFSNQQTVFVGSALR